MGKTNDKKKTNSQKHRKNVSDKMKKIREQKYKKNMKKYDTAGKGGTRVVQHSKNSISGAPAMQPEKINRKGFVNTFPTIGAGQGFFDKRQTINDILNKERTRVMAERILVDSAIKYGLNEEETKELMDKRAELLQQQTETRRVAELKKLEESIGDEKVKEQQLRDSLKKLNNKKFGLLQTNNPRKILEIQHVSQRELRQAKENNERLIKIEEDEENIQKLNTVSNHIADKLGIDRTYEKEVKHRDGSTSTVQKEEK